MITAALTKLVLQKASGGILDLVQSGALQAFGSTLVDPTSRRTVGYLQARDTLGAAADTAKVVASLGAFANPVTAPFGVAYAAGKTGFAIFDTQRTSHRIEDKLDTVAEGVLRSEKKLEDGLGGLTARSRSTVALQFLDIGINVAGFATLGARLDEIAVRASAIDAGFREFQESQLTLAFTNLKTLARSLDEGWRLSGNAATNRWQSVASEALHLQDQFEARSRGVLTRPDPDYLLADAMLDAVSFANGLRVAALAACNQINAARSAAEDGARVLDSLSGRVGLAELVRPVLAASGSERGTREFSVALAKANEDARPLDRKFRQREANALTRAAPLVSLERRGIRPRAWLEEVRSLTETALVFMPEPERN